MLSYEEIINRLRDEIESYYAELILKGITRLSTRTNSFEKLSREMTEYNSATIERQYLELLIDFYVIHRDSLENNNEYDWNAIYEKCIKLIDQGRDNIVIDFDNNIFNLNLKNLKFIFVDEFQDFSELYR